MPAILPLLLSIAPELARWVFGARGEETAALAARAVQAATGTGDEAAARAALDADPAKGMELRLALARIAADAEAAARKAELDELAARLADTADARRQTVALAQAGSGAAWAAPVVSLVVTLGFFAAVALVFLVDRTWDERTAGLLNVLLGALVLGFGQVVNYWLGSSAGSARKDEAIRAAGQPPGAGH